MTRGRSERVSAPETHQSVTLARHIRNALQGDDKKLWDAGKAEYWRAATKGEKVPSTIGFLSALLALSYRDLCELESL